MKKNYLLALVSMLFLSSCDFQEYVDKFLNKESASEIESASIKEESIEEIESQKESESISIISEEESESEEINLNEGNKEVEILDEYFEDKANNDLTTYNNAFEYSTYTYSIEPNSSYDDNDRTKLTDGISNAVFDKENWVGFYSKQYDVTIDFELDMAFCISYFNVHMLQVISYAIYYPESVTLYASYDGNRYDKLSTIYTPSQLSADSEYTYNFHYEKYVTARYYRFFIKGLSNHVNQFGNHSSYFLFVDEIEAFEFASDGEHQYGETNIIDNYYNYDIDTSSNYKYDSTAADYNDHINLASLDNVDIDVTSFEKLKTNQTASNSKPEEMVKLVDGKKATQTTPSDKNWVKFAYGYGRDIVFDFKDKVAIDTVNMQLLNYMNSSINIPEKIGFFASDDGTKFEKVAVYDTNKYQQSTNELFDLSQEFEEPFACRYLMVRFVTNYNLTDIVKAYISEIEILGYKNASLATKDYRQNNYPDTSIVNNICYVANNLEKEKYLPFCGYIDENGNIVDYMFDCLSLQIFTGIDNLEGNTYNEKVTTLINSYVASINTINEAMNDVNTALKKNEKMKMFVSLPIAATDTNFVTKMNNFVDSFLLEYEKGSCPNIDFLGFYWNNEYISGTAMDSFMGEMVQVNNYLNSKGYISFWCPFYMADGVCRKDDTGCAFACMQPNYMFWDIENYRLDSTAKVASIYDVCVEIEIEAVNNKVSISKYYEYLIWGIKYGYMNSIKVYYQGNYAFYNACNSNHKLYEATYLYAHEKLTEDFFVDAITNIDSYTGIEKNCNVDDESVKVTIPDIKEDLTITVKQIPTYGDILVELDGSITYYPQHEYLGNDYLIITVSNSKGSKDIRIDFNITK